MLLLLLLISTEVRADSSIVCSTSESNYDVTFVDTTQRSWLESYNYCRDEHKGHLVKLVNDDVTSCIMDYIANMTSRLNNVYEVGWWTGARFDCPSVYATTRGLVTTNGRCHDRKSFICQYGGKSPQEVVRLLVGW